jgi:hypothetical protein
MAGCIWGEARDWALGTGYWEWVRQQALVFRVSSTSIRLRRGTLGGTGILGLHELVIDPGAGDGYFVVNG